MFLIDQNHGISHGETMQRREDAPVVRSELDSLSNPSWQIRVGDEKTSELERCN